MKGIPGIHKCSCGFDVWGVTVKDMPGCNANIDTAIEEPSPYLSPGNDACFPTYDIEGPKTNLEMHGDIVYPYVEKIITPNVSGARTPNKTWSIYAVKVPSSYPYGSCEQWPHVDSGTYDGDGSWEAPLCVGMEHRVRTIGGDDYHGLDTFRRAYLSKAVYIDGHQAIVTYGITATWLSAYPDADIRSGDPDASSIQHNGTHITMRDHVQINIRDQSTKLFYVGKADGVFRANGSFADDLTYHEWNFYHFIIPGTLGTGFSTIPDAVNCISYGKAYCIHSTYTPNHPTETEYNWGLCRLKYEGSRLSSPGLEYFTTKYDPIGFNPGYGLTMDEPEKLNNSEDHAILLPSHHVYIDSSVLNGDECWVVAKRLDDTPGLVCGQWLNNEYRIGTNDENQATGAADGTLQAGEIKTTIIPLGTPEEEEEFEGEEWENIRVRSYLHKNGKDYVLFTTGGDPVVTGPFTATFEEGDEPDPTYSGTALSGSSYYVDLDTDASSIHNFYRGMRISIVSGMGSGQSELVTSYNATLRQIFVEDGWVTPPNNTSVVEITEVIDQINTGLPEGLKFTTHGSVSGNRWMADTDSAINGTYSGTTNLNVLFEGSCDLVLRTNFTDGGTISFNYRLDNRRSGSRLPDHPDFTELTNIPEPDNYLALYDNGVRVKWWNNTEFSDSGSTFTSEGQYLASYSSSYDVPAGTHTIRFSLIRTWAGGNTKAWLDNIVFPEVMLSDDLEGTKRWMYTGERVVALHNWSWAARDEDTQDSSGNPIEPPVISGRVSTLPDFITADNQGRILVGNPHYIYRFLPDGTLDESHGTKGGVRWTASPNTQTFEPSCWSPEIAWDGTPNLDPPTPDGVADPPWGAMQILPYKDGSYQVRGVNGSLKDITHFPFRKSLYRLEGLRGTREGESFKSACKVYSGDWGQRLHCWTVKNDGKIRIPHIDVAWRQPKFLPSWPDSVADAVSPPYASNFNTANQGSDLGWGWFRPWDATKIPEGSRKARWSATNHFIPRSYSNFWSSRPQFTWMCFTLDPPYDPNVGEGEQPYGYYNPNWEYEEFANWYGPWGSSKWKCYKVRTDPTVPFGFNQYYAYNIPDYVSGLSQLVDVCEEEETEGSEGNQYIHIPLTGIYMGRTSRSDFDIIDEPCPSCSDEPYIPEEE